MKIAYIVRPTDDIPDVLHHPLTEIKNIVEVICPKCDYKAHLYYIHDEDSESVRTDVKHYEKELESEHLRLGGHKIIK